MGLSDPFDTTAKLAQERSRGIERGFGTLGQAAMQFGQSAMQGASTQNLLKSMGIISDKTEPVTSKDYEDVAKKAGITDFAVNPKMTEEEKIGTAQKMFDVLGLPHPKPKTGMKFDYEQAAKAGLTYKPDMFGGQAEFNPTKLEASPMETALKYKQAQEAITAIGLPEGTQATAGKGGISIKAPSSASEKASINKTRASDILAGIQKGSKGFVPDLVAGFGNPELRAELVTQAIDKNIDLQTPMLEWAGAKRLANSLNAPAQARLQQVISYADKSIPQMRELSDVFKRFDFTPANAAELKAAMTSTAVSPELRDAATKFMVQYSTMRSDLAQVFSGGYAPTQDSYKLADESLNKLWGRGQMSAGLDQLEIDLGFKAQALQEVQQTSAMGRYGGMGSQLTQAAGLGGLKQIQSDDDYNSLPSGAEFIGPDGQRRRKP